MATRMIVPPTLDQTRSIRAGKSPEIGMIGNNAFVALAIITAMGALSTPSANASFFWGHRHRGGFLVPCSLDGVNPVYHPEVFGNPATALRDFGFVQGPDRRWHVVNNCVRGLNHN